MQNRFNRHLLCSAFSFGLPEIYLVQITTESLSVNTALFWSKPSFKGNHKTNEDSGICHVGIEFEVDNNFRSYFIDGINKKGTNASTLKIFLRTLTFLINSALPEKFNFCFFTRLLHFHFGKRTEH